MKKFTIALSAVAITLVICSSDAAAQCPNFNAAYAGLGYNADPGLPIPPVPSVIVVRSRTFRSFATGGSYGTAGGFNQFNTFGGFGPRINFNVGNRRGFGGFRVGGIHHRGRR